MSKSTMRLIITILLVYSAIIMVLATMDFINSGYKQCSEAFLPWLYLVLFTLPIAFCMTADIIYEADIVDSKDKKE